MLIDDLGLKAAEKGSLDRFNNADKKILFMSTFHLFLFSAVSFRVRRSYLLLTEQSQG